MKTIRINGKIIYRASKGKRVKFIDCETLYSEISVNKDDTRKVEEVDNGNVR